MPIKVPTQKTVLKTLENGAVGGLIGGFSVLLCRAFMGVTAGSIVGGIIGGSIVHGYDPEIGKIVAVNGFMDGVASLGLQGA